MALRVAVSTLRSFLHSSTGFCMGDAGKAFKSALPCRSTAFNVFAFIIRGWLWGDWLNQNCVGILLFKGFYLVPDAFGLCPKVFQFFGVMRSVVVSHGAKMSISMTVKCPFAKSTLYFGFHIFIWLD